MRLHLAREEGLDVVSASGTLSVSRSWGRAQGCRWRRGRWRPFRRARTGPTGSPSDGRGSFRPAVFGAALEHALERVAVLDERRGSSPQERADCVLLRRPRPPRLRRPRLSSSAARAPGRPLAFEPRDALGRGLEVEAQRPFDGDLAVAEVRGRKDPADAPLPPCRPSRLRVSPSRNSARISRMSLRALERNLAALVAEALAHRRSRTPVASMSCTLPLRAGGLAVGDHPDVGGDAGVVEQLLGQRDHRLQQVVFQDPSGGSRSRRCRRRR